MLTEARLFFVLFLSGTAWIGLQAQEPPSEADMAAYLALAQPGPEHDLLKQFEGEWDQDVKMWMQPGQPPMEAKSHTSAKMVLGGRFLQTSGEVGEPPMQFSTFGMMGFDRRHKEFTMVAFDTMGTYYVTASGAYDVASKTISLYGEDEDPIMGFTQKYYIHFKWHGPDQYSTEVIFVDFPGAEEKEFKMVEVLSTRK